MSLSHLKCGENGKGSLELQFSIMNAYLNLRSNGCLFSLKRLNCTSFKAAKFRFRAMVSWGQLELMRNSRIDQVYGRVPCILGVFAGQTSALVLAPFSPRIQAVAARSLEFLE